MAKNAPKRRTPRKSGPTVRRGSFHVNEEVAARLRCGHPWVYREDVGTKAIDRYHGQLVQITDPQRKLIGHAIADKFGAVCARIVAHTDNEEFHLATAVTQHVRAAVKRRKRFLVDGFEHTAFRVLSGDSESLPGITADYYGGFIVVTLFSESLIDCARPLYDALAAELSPIGIYEQRRFSSVGGKKPEQSGATLVHGVAAPVTLNVRENDLQFEVDVTAPLSPGLFCDLREGRILVGQHAAGQDVLNLFSYTGSFSVYAQRAGAKSVTAVDSAPKAHARARKNFSLNEMDPEVCDHVVADARTALAKFAQRGRHFDLTIIDPPAFGSPVARGQKPWIALRDYAELLADVATVTRPGGLILAVSSTHKLSPEGFEEAIASAASSAKRHLSILSRVRLPWDYMHKPCFPEGEYLKAALLLCD